MSPDKIIEFAEVEYRPKRPRPCHGFQAVYEAEKEGVELLYIQNGRKRLSTASPSPLRQEMSNMPIKETGIETV
jgi:hypothetical protein